MQILVKLSVYPFNTLQASDILKMCMKKFHAEKYFETNLQSFINLPIVSRVCFK